MAISYTSAFSSVDFKDHDHAAYTATSDSGRRLGIYWPSGSPSDYPVNAGHPDRFAVLVIASLSGDSTNGTTSSSTFGAGSTITASNGIAYQALQRGIAVAYAQITSGRTSNTGVIGNGWVHMPGGTQGYYESRNRPSIIKDIEALVRHIRYNSRVYKVGDSRSYKVHGEALALTGVSSAFCTTWIAAAPNRQNSLGQGGQHDESTVPNAWLIDLTAIIWWDHFLNSEALTGALGFPLAESGGAGADDTIASDLAHAPERYRRGWSGASLLSDIGEACIPPTFWHSNSAPSDNILGQPFSENVRAFADGVHDSHQLLTLSVLMPKGLVKAYPSRSVRYTLSTTASGAAIPPGLFDGFLEGTAIAFTGSSGTISLTGVPADTNTVTISDGIRSKVFEFDTGGAVTAGNYLVDISAGGITAAQCMTALNAAITASGLALSQVATASTLTTYTTTAVPGNVTITKSGGNISVTGFSGGTQTGNESGWIPAAGNIAWTGSTSDGDLITISDGITTAVFKYTTTGTDPDPTIYCSITGTASASRTRFLTQLALAQAAGFLMSGFNLTTFPLAASVQVDLTNNTQFMAGNVTITKTGANITVTGMTGGNPAASAIASESAENGVAINWLLKNINTPRWDIAAIKKAGIRRHGPSAQVNTTGRICVPPNPGREDGGGIWLTCASLSCDSDLLYGATQYGTKLLPRGATVFIPGAGALWLRAAGGGTQVAKFDAREVASKEQGP